ncbi:M36 family metallopeptidase [Chryseobacterium wanjuense]
MFGFTPVARNFQQTNFGLGGLGNDYVNVEAQDGGGLNNANFATPADGTKPRMQMYLWSPKNRIFFYNAPSVAVPREPNVGTALFGCSFKCHRSYRRCAAFIGFRWMYSSSCCFSYWKNRIGGKRNMYICS